MSEQVRLRPVTPREHEAAAGVLARGMRDNPVHVAAFGPDPDRRQWCLERMFRGLLRVVPERTMIGAFDGDTLVGFAVDATPGTCRLGPVRKARAATSMITVGPASLLRVLDWQGTWERHHPTGAHHHLGPIAVDRGRQGSGIGSMIMKELAARWDRTDDPAYLETDKSQNVDFYRRHGFTVIADGPVLGRPNWLMLREPRP